MSALAASTDSRALRGSAQPDVHAEMVAPSISASSAPVVSDNALVLANVNTSSDAHTPCKQTHPDQHWDGRRVTLSSWYAEFETTLSYVSPTLYEFAVNDRCRGNGLRRWL